MVSDCAEYRVLWKPRKATSAGPDCDFARSRKLFVALARRYGLEPYRYQRQRHNTVMVRVSRRFVDDTLWPEFSELDRTLREGLARATDTLIANVFHQESTEAEVRPEPLMLGR
jgi:hypothetical protein